MDRGAWQATVQGVANSQGGLSNYDSLTHLDKTRHQTSLESHFHLHKTGVLDLMVPKIPSSGNI